MASNDVIVLNACSSFQSTELLFCCGCQSYALDKFTHAKAPSSMQRAEVLRVSSENLSM